MTAKRLVPLFFLALAALFLIANRGAYKGYFQDDDLDNLSFTREMDLADFFTPLILPKVEDHNFRPIGHLFYRVMGSLAQLRFPPYIFVLHALHLLAGVLLWFVLRRLGLPYLAAGSGVLFFAFHMAAFDVFWKPMYVFDLLCGVFCLISLLGYLQGRWVLSLLALWLAYRSKEVAVMLPVVFGAYEYLLGGRNWKRLLPFAGFSLVIGIQALVHNQNATETAYTLRFDPVSLWTCLRYYVPVGWLLASFLLIFVRDRRVWFGVIAFCSLLLPMLLLPGRLFSAYLYVPLIGLSIALAALAAKLDRRLVASFFLIWLPWNFVVLRRDRNMALSDVADRRAFVTGVSDFARQNPDVLSYVYNPSGIESIQPYAARAAVKLAHPPGASVRFFTPYTANVTPLAVLSWDPKAHKLIPLLRRSETPDAAYIKMGPQTPIWQLEQGWYEREGTFRWTKPYATARLAEPPGAREFELVVNVGPEYIAKVQRSHVTVALNGNVIGEQDFTRPGWQTVRFLIAHPQPGPVEMALRVSPEFQAGRVLGIAVVAFGFVPHEPLVESSRKP